MQEEKHIAAIQEVNKTIKQALADPEGLLSHQRRIMSMLSLGAQHAIEVYLHRKAAIQSGAQIKHEWFKLSDVNLKERLQPTLTQHIQDIPLLTELCFFAKTIEQERNDLIYGAPLTKDTLLRTCIDAFLSIKTRIERESGPLT